MIALHAIWNNLTKNLYIWSETTTPRKERTRNYHPFALPSLSLLKELELLTTLEAEPGTLVMQLPSTSRPLPSPELVTEHMESPSKLSSWEIPSVIFDPLSAFNFLLSLPENPLHGVSYGSSLRFWMVAAKFALELLTRKCFLPTIRKEKGKFMAVWEVFLTNTDEERMHVLSQGMPPVCRAFVPCESSPSGIVRDFLDTAVDGFIRTMSFKMADTSPPAQWLTALFSDPYLPTHKEMKNFSSAITSWLTPLGESDAPLHLCFKLDPPQEKGEWVLSYHLQARDDKSLLIPAEKVWRAGSHISVVKRTFENPQERLLTELGKASRLYPVIDKSLKTPHPTHLRLTPQDAYTFLRQAVPLMEGGGFSFLLPPWWQKPMVRPGVRLRMRTTSTGLFGMESILSYDWVIALGEETLSPEEFKELAELKVPLVKIRGQWVELRPEDVEKAISFFEKFKSGEMTLSEALRLKLGGERSTGLPITDIEGEGEIGRVLDDLLHSTMSGLEPPEAFHGSLRPYQVRGVSWLSFLDNFGLGACLADDMGLGKTVQVIALLLHERTHRKVNPTLVVCPMSVVTNWYKEVKRFAPSLKVLIHHGQDRLSDSFEKKVKGHDLVITTYSLVHRDEPFIKSVEWERVILDEAQNIKNPAAKQTQAVKKIAAKRKIALTGTPVENRLQELWSIMDFLNKGYLGSQKEFMTKFCVPIERFRDPYKAETLKSLMQPFVLRRLKTDKTIIRDLPEKVEMKVFSNLTREQATLYEAVVEEMLEKIENSEGIERKGLVLSTLMKLKQVSNHPAQFFHDKSEAKGRSGKLIRLQEMLEEVLAEGGKALIFTQFREMGHILHGYLQEELSCEILFLHGGTPKRKRDIMVERFQSGKGPPLFILSLKAGGLGLNLTEANHVFHFDRWWNPAVENQATDRAFRIGQKKNVFVHKFVCIGTVEEKIDALIEQKKELAEKIVGAGEEWITEMSTEQLKELFTMGEEAVGGE